MKTYFKSPNIERVLFSIISLTILVLAYIYLDISSVSGSYSSLQRLNDERNDSFEDIGYSIDMIGAHPDDPQLPDSILGASNQVLYATSPLELADVLLTGEEYAYKNIEDNPRYAFALGRIAFELDYRRKAKELLLAADSNGSPAASEYLGYMAVEEGDYEAANDYFLKAKQGGFPRGVSSSDTIDTKDFLSDFHNRDIVYALLTYNEEELLKLNKIPTPYRVTKFISSCQKFLSSTEVFFLVENFDIIKEIDPELSMSVEGILREFGGSVVGESVMAGDIHDAKILAMLYDSNPEAFRRIYSGMVKFFKKESLTKAIIGS